MIYWIYKNVDKRYEVVKNEQHFARRKKGCPDRVIDVNEYVCPGELTLV